jgi:Na+:H+ antiporter, NhaC family
MDVPQQALGSPTPGKNALRLGELIVIIGAVLAGLFTAYTAGIPLVIGFAAGFAVLWITAVRKGIPFRTLARNGAEGAAHTKEVMWILLLVGLMIPSWMASGTIPYLIETGLRLMDPAFFVTGCFLLCTVISMVLGTSTGTLSSAGIPLMGMAAVLQVPLPLAAGAIISGAFVGDRTSPLSSANQLVASSTGIAVRRLAGALAPTTIAALAISLGFFILQDRLGHWSTPTGTGWSTGYDDVFRLHPALTLPPLLLVGSILFRLRTRYAFLISIGSAILVGLTMQQIQISEWPDILWFGYTSDMISTLYSKGAGGMLGLILLIGLAGAFNGILEEQGLIRPYVERIVGASFGLPAASLRTGLFGLILGLISCNQTLPIMMTGRNLHASWTIRHPESELARTVADTSLIFAAMVPWNMLAILCGTILGLPVEDYVPYAVFLWSLPVLTLLLSVWRGKRLTNL